MRKIESVMFLVLLFGVLAESLWGQDNRAEVSGYVIDKNNQKPLVGVNVFISGTMWGSSTDQNGYFTIKNIIPGSHVVVASIIGYEAGTRNIKLNKGDKLQVSFDLATTVYEITEVQVYGSRPREWFEYLKYFRVLFLGQSEYAWGCIISNELEINFQLRNRRFSANSQDPVSVVNRGLGFRADCILMEFSYDFSNNNLRYVIQPKFVELINRNREELEDWRDNRIRAYNGSQHHFLKSLIDGTYEEKGYYMWLTDKPEENKKPNEIIKADSILTVDSVNNKYILKFDKYLQVKYVPKETVSWIKLLQDEVIFDEFAYPESTVPFNISGDWGRLGVADMLPKYYFDN